MPVYSIPGPGGQIFEITGPAGATKEQVIERVKASPAYQQAMAPPVTSDVGNLRNLPKLVTEGLPAAGRKFTEVMQEPSYAANMMNTPLKYTPIPGAYDIAAKGLRIFPALGAAAAELGPERAKPLTEAGFGLLPFARGLRKPRLPLGTPPAAAAATAAEEAIPGFPKVSGGTPSVETSIEGTSRLPLGPRTEVKWAKGPKSEQAVLGKSTAKGPASETPYDPLDPHAPTKEATRATFQTTRKEAADRAKFPIYKEVVDQHLTPPEFFDPASMAPGEALPKTAWARMKQRVGDVLPQDYAVWRVRPNSPVVTAFEDSRTEMDRIMNKVWDLKTMRERSDPELWKRAEHTAYEQGRLAGGNLEAAIKALPEEMQGPVKLMHELRPLEKKYRLLLGDKVLEDETLYLLPHIVEKDLHNVIKVTRFKSGLGGEWQSTLGAFEKPRVYPTMLTGEALAKDLAYADPKQALLYRIWASAKLIHTGKFIENLERDGALFRTSKAAAEASPSRKAFRVEGIPGKGDWYAPTRQEALFIRDHLRDPNVAGSIARIGQFANAFFRNFNFWNPLPHFAKNMLYKYGFSGGSLRKVFSDMNEYFQGSNPEMKALYQKFMPHIESGRSAYDILAESRLHIKGMNSFEWLWHKANTPNRASSRLVFGKLDPGLKYARFKQYVNKGVDPQNAALQTNLDLVRYSTRSQAVDAWKAIPFNFFVPWRVGTATSTIKNFRQAPMKAALWVTAFDILREQIYGSRGDWFHAPIDYMAGPMTRVVEEGLKGPGALASELGKLLATTAAFGPGGENVAKFATELADDYKAGKIDPKIMQRALWGFAIVSDPRVGLAAIPAFLKDGDWKHIADLVMSATFAVHSSLNYAPHRPLEAINWPKSPDVQRAEDLQEAFRKKREAAQARRAGRTRPSIEEMIHPR